MIQYIGLPLWYVCSFDLVVLAISVTMIFNKLVTMVAGVVISVNT